MNKKIIWSIILIILTISIGTLLIILFSKDKESDAIKFKNEYESLNDIVSEKSGKKTRSIKISDNNPMIYKTADEIVEMIDSKETFVIYFGFPDCPWCRSVLPTLIDVATSLNIEKIYYVDVKDIRDVKEIDENEKIKTTKEGSEGYYKLLKKLDSVLSEYILRTSDGKTIDTKEKRIMAPNVIVIKDGKPKSLTTGVSKKQTDAYMELTDEMKEEMYNNFKTTLKEIFSSDGGTCELDQNC